MIIVYYHSCQFKSNNKCIGLYIVLMGVCVAALYKNGGRPVYNSEMDRLVIAGIVTDKHRKGEGDQEVKSSGKQLQQKI